MGHHFWTFPPASGDQLNEGRFIPRIMRDTAEPVILRQEGSRISRTCIFQGRGESIV
jgi:hypothetical protein